MGGAGSIHANDDRQPGEKERDLLRWVYENMFERDGSKIAIQGFGGFFLTFQGQEEKYSIKAHVHNCIGPLEKLTVFHTQLDGKLYFKTQWGKYLSAKKGDGSAPIPLFADSDTAGDHEGFELFPLAHGFCALRHCLSGGVIQLIPNVDSGNEVMLSFPPVGGSSLAIVDFENSTTLRIHTMIDVQSAFIGCDGSFLTLDPESLEIGSGAYFRSSLTNFDKVEIDGKIYLKSCHNNKFIRCVDQNRILADQDEATEPVEIFKQRCNRVTVAFPNGGFFADEAGQPAEDWNMLTEC